MICADITGMKQQQRNLAGHALRLKTYVQELEEIVNSMEGRGNLEDFIPVVRIHRDTLHWQLRGLQQAEGKLEEVICCCQEAEKRIIQEYEQEKFVLQRYKVEYMSFSTTLFTALDIRVTF